jgi:hypothetical protein
MLDIKWFPDWKIIEKTEDYVVYKNLKTGFEQKIYECKPMEKAVGEEILSPHETRKLSMLIAINGCLSPNGRSFIIPLSELPNMDCFYDL